MSSPSYKIVFSVSTVILLIVAVASELFPVRIIYNGNGLTINFSDDYVTGELPKQSTTISGIDFLTLQ